MTPTIEAQLRKKLERLSQLRPGVFGSDAHNFELHPPLSEARVAQFERHAKIALPSDYRWFITTIGDGGAGPFYGVFRLGEMDDDFASRRWQEGDAVVGSLAAPFLLSDEWNDLTGKPEDSRSEDDPDAYEAQLDAFEERYFHPVDGAIPICHRGCALRVWLVVSGPETGNLWDDNRADYEGFAPIAASNAPRTSFLTWYHGWMDTSLERTNV